MKRIIVFLMFLVFILCGCGTNTGLIDEILNEEEATVYDEQSYANSSVEESDTSEEVDIDLTEMSSNMIYSEVYNMMTNPNEYIGENIKISGLYRNVYWEETGNYYHFVIITDALACCESGLEFVLKDGEYPQDNMEIEIVGTFESYIELEKTYYFIDANSNLNK